MNGDTIDNRCISSDLPPESNGTSGCSPRSPTGTLPINNYSSSPRLRRLDDMKRSYLTGSSVSSTPPQSTYGSKFSTTGSASSGSSSYRLASLDRLAYRQKLYETTGLDKNGAAINATNGVNGTSNGTSTGVTNGASNITSITTSSSVLPSPKDNREIVHNPPTSPTSGVGLQSKREMFFKNDPSSGAAVNANSTPQSTLPPGTPTSLTHPSTAPPAPPAATTVAPTSNHANHSSTNNSTAPPPNMNSTSTNVNSTTLSNGPTGPAVNSSGGPGTTTSVASIKEQLLTTKERKEDENKETKVKDIARERRPREVDGYVGFANLPNQVYRKAVKKGFEFCLMVVGESGLGKSTLINSMFLSDIYSADHPGPSHRVKKTVQVETTKVLLKENSVNLMLTVVDTPGFGDAVDNSDCWQPVIDCIENKYEEYLNAEARVNRKLMSDSRVHCCLYFIAASGHGLKPLDVEFMRRLHDKVNIIPVIAKADTLTPEECAHLKKQILNEISQHKIKIYEFPEDDGDGTTAKMKQRVPFAVVGSNFTVEVDGKKVRGRKYPWGVVEVENLDHCDFIPLRNMMIRTHMQDLKDVTNNVHYENFRCKKLAGIGGNEGKLKGSNKNPLTQMEEEKTDHSIRMKKMESEMEQVFEMKVKEKMGKLNELENDLQKRNESMRKKLEMESREQEEERERFLRERAAWEAANNVTIEELRRRSLESISREHVDGKVKHKKKGLF